MKAFKKTLKAIKQQVGLTQPPAVLTQAEPIADAGLDFQQLFSDVTPLKAKAKHCYAPPKPRPKPRPASNPQPANSTTLAYSFDLSAEHDAEPYFARSGIASSTLKKLRSGQWAVVGQLDLHGYDRYQAQAALTDFLALASRLGQCVRIIHGKGLSSNGAPVLKHLVRAWLKLHPTVLAFCQTNDAMGGSGAVLVLLKPRRGHVPDEEAIR